MPETVSFYNAGLEDVPEWVWDATELRVLNLSVNHLTRVSERLGDLRHLHTLDLGHNWLTELPARLGQLTELSEYLYVHDNRLAHLPYLGGLRTLRYLNVSDNPLGAVPDWVAELHGLR